MDIPYTKCVAVTPDDTDPILDGSDPIVSRGILIGGAGSLTFEDREGNSSTVSGLALNVIHPIRAKKILDTGTAATDIYAFW